MNHSHPGSCRSSTRVTTTRGAVLVGVLVLSALFGPRAQADVVVLIVEDFQETFDRILRQFKSTTKDMNVGTVLSSNGVTFSVSGNPYSSQGSVISLAGSMPALPEATRIRQHIETELVLDSFEFYPKNIQSLGSIFVAPVEPTIAGVRHANRFFEVREAQELPLLPSRVTLSIGVQTPPGNNGAFNGSGSYAVRFEVDRSVTRRMHWQGDEDIPSLSNAANWLENLTPDDDSAAVFGKFGAPNQQSFDRSQSWRGLVVDGPAGIDMDLQGHTLTLGRSNLVADDFSISIGEERRGDSRLQFTNGVVRGDRNIILESRSPTFDVGSASLVVGAGADVEIAGIVSTGRRLGQGGVLNVRDAGARLSAFGLRLGAVGSGQAVVENGGRVEIEQLLELAQGTSGRARANMRVAGRGSSLIVSGEGKGSSLVLIGGIDQGRLEIASGATADFNASEVTIGSNLANSGSVLNIVGAGTRLTGGTYNLARGATLQVLDGAELITLSGAGFAVGTDALLSIDGGSKVVAGNLFVNATQAQARITAGGQLNLSGEVRVAQTSSLFVGGAGSSLRGFSDMLINGDLLVGQGAVVTGRTMNVGAAGRVIIANGSVTVNEFVMQDGALISDTLAFAPGDDGGGGGDGGGDGEPALLRVATTFGVADLGEPVFAGFDANSVAPQGSAIEINGNVLLQSRARLELDVFAGDDFDQLFVDGDLDFNGQLFVLFDDSFTPTTDAIFDLIHVTGRFSGLADNQIIVRGLHPGWDYATSRTGNGMFTLTTRRLPAVGVPSPDCFVLISLASIGIAAGRRRLRLLRTA